jgi:shikimate 5-dehydrogenase
LEPFEHPAKPTFYFIGVSTAHSKIMGLFPRWVEILGLPETEIRGIDVEVRGPAEMFRSIIEHMRDESMVLGGLVTTHKIDMLEKAGDLLQCLDMYAKLFGEISVLSKRSGKLCGHAKDPISAGLALEAFLPKGHWLGNPDAQAFVMGAGGSGLALSAYLLREEHGDNRPVRIILSNRRSEPLEHARRVHGALRAGARDGRTEVEYVQIGAGRTNDDVLESLPPGSLVVNATGMGKDIPGSPLSDGAVFPERGSVWDFNYRGSLEFLRQAERQKTARDLCIEDGWVYFIHGWLQAIGEVFGIPTGPKEYGRLAGVAAAYGPEARDTGSRMVRDCEE